MIRNLPKLNITPNHGLPSKYSQKKKVYQLNCIFTNENKHSLYIGGKNDAENLKILTHYKISHVYNVAKNEVSPSWKDNLDVSIGYTHLPMQDNASLSLNPLFLIYIISLIHESLESGNVLVNCFMGKSRSVTIVAAYLMWRCDITFNIAMRWISSHRNCASPNYGFCSFLLLWKPPKNFYGFVPPPKIPWYTPLPYDSENDEKGHDLFW